MVSMASWRKGDHPSVHSADVSRRALDCHALSRSGRTIESFCAFFPPVKVNQEQTGEEKWNRRFYCQCRRHVVLTTSVSQNRPRPGKGGVTGDLGDLGDSVVPDTPLLLQETNVEAASPAGAPTADSSPPLKPLCLPPGWLILGLALFHLFTCTWGA